MDHSHQQRNDNPAYKEIPLTREDQKNYEYLFGTADDDFQGGATGTTMEPSVATAFPLLAPVHTALHLPSQTTTDTSVPRIQRIQLPAQLRNDGFFTGSYAQEDLKNEADQDHQDQSRRLSPLDGAPAPQHQSRRLESARSSSRSRRGSSSHRIAKRESSSRPSPSTSSQLRWVPYAVPQKLQKIEQSQSGVVETICHERRQMPISKRIQAIIARRTELDLDTHMGTALPELSVELMSYIPPTEESLAAIVELVQRTTLSAKRSTSHGQDSLGSLVVGTWGIFAAMVRAQKSSHRSTAKVVTKSKGKGNWDEAAHRRAELWLTPELRNDSRFEPVVPFIALPPSYFVTESQTDSTDYRCYTCQQESKSACVMPVKLLVGTSGTRKWLHTPCTHCSPNPCSKTGRHLGERTIGPLISVVLNYYAPSVYSLLEQQESRGRRGNGTLGTDIGSEGS